MSKSIPHDPNARLDYTCDFTPWLRSGETVTAHDAYSEGLELESTGISGAKITTWVKPVSTLGFHKIVFQVTTSAGRTDERSITLEVLER